MRGEVLASRGLALSCIGRLELARELARQALSSTQAIEAKVLARAVHTVAALRARESTCLSSLCDLVSASFESGAVDPLITAYRGCPDLLSSMLSYEPTRESAIFVLARAGDDRLASRDGSRPSERLRPLESLTRREREVCDLACHGLSNHDIAQALFIAESTVKVHLHKIYDKAGVRSRSALMSLVAQNLDEYRSDD
jgi:DNA-binding NarL/FixJ family response regulator